MMLDMKPFVRILTVIFISLLSLNQTQAQVTYEIQIDSLVGLPDTITDGETVTFYMQISLNSPLIYQGNIFLELEYGGNFYQLDTTYSQNFINPNFPSQLQATHLFSTNDDLSIGDNVVVVWPRIGDGTTPLQTVANPYTTTITLREPNGIGETGPRRIVKSFIRPNPAITNIEFRVSPEVRIYRSILYDLTGKILAESGREKQLDVSRLPAGIYFVDVLTEEGNIYSDKLLITR